MGDNVFVIIVGHYHYFANIALDCLEKTLDADDDGLKGEEELSRVLCPA